MIESLVSLIVLLVIGGLCWYLITLLPLPPPIKQVIQVVAILILILVIVAFFFGDGLPSYHWRH